MIGVERAAAHELAEGLPLGGVVGAPVVAVHARPIDVAVARVDVVVRSRYRARNIRAPDPADVLDALLSEDVVDVAPGSNVVSGLIAVDLDGPGERPGTIHLVVEAQEEGLAPGLCRLRPLGHV